MFLIPAVCRANSIPPKSGVTADGSATTYAMSDYERSMDFIRELRSQKKYPEHRLNCMEGDIYFKRGNYFDALKFYKRAMYDKNVRDSVDFIKRMEYRKILCYDEIDNLSRLAYLVNRLYESAEETGDQEFLTVATFYKGKIDYYRGNKQEGYRLMNRAIEEMKQTDVDTKYEHLLFFYITLVKAQQADSLSADALKTLQAVDKLLKEAKTRKPFPFFAEDIQMKEYYAYYAVTLQRLGREEEAKEYYDKYLSLGHVFDYDYSCIEPYLFDRHLYDDIIRFGELRRTYLRSTNDTLNYSMVSICRLLARAYALKGDYQHSLSNYHCLEILHDKMKATEELSAMDELSSNYATYENALSSQRKSHSKNIRYILIIAGIIVVAIGFIIYQAIHYNRVITRKNISLVKTIDDLLKAKRQYYSEVVLPEAGDEPEPEPEEEKETQLLEVAKTDTSERQEKKWFEKMSRDIVEKKLYLDPNLSRMILLEKYRIPKNSFSQLFQKYAGTSYSKYINDLRLEHAAKMLKEHPGFTVEAVAIDCGISSVATLYRLFSKKYGMTPTEYRFFADLPKEEKAPVEELEEV